MHLKILFSLLVTLCTLSVAFANNVIQLNSDNFDEITKKYDVVFINFYADWCRFSQMLAPVFEESYGKVKAEFPQENQVIFAKVDCEVEGKLASKFHISKYPTLKLMLNGKIYKKEYRGNRGADAMAKYIHKVLSDPIQMVDTLDAYNRIDEKKAAVVAYFSDASKSSPEYQMYRKVAADLRDECNFIWVTGDPASVYAAKNNLNNKIVFKPSQTRLNEKDLVYPGGLHSFNELSTWTTDKCIPLVREITFENAEELTEEGLPFMILFYHPDDKASIEVYRNLIYRDLYSESSTINFLIADGKKFAHPLHHLGKTVRDLPLIAIDSFRHMYMFPKFSDINVPNKLREFIQDLHSGKLHREFHFGPDTPSIAQQDSKIVTTPPESTFAKLAPSSNRYTLLKDEL